jgi:phosphoribosylglycinamide formyltransferase-1
MKKNIAIFASGSGSNAENIIRYFQKNDSVQVSLVLSNKSDAYVLERAHRLGVPSNVFPKEDWIAGDEILAILQEYRIDFVVLAPPRWISPMWPLAASTVSGKSA